MLYNIPRFFEITWVSKTDPVTNSTTGVEIAMQDLRQDPTYINVYITWMYLVFMYILPFGGLSVLNTLMYLDVRRSNARQSTLSASEKKELRLAVMLMTVVVVFQICNILPLIANILEVNVLPRKALFIFCVGFQTTLSPHIVCHCQSQIVMAPLNKST